MSDTDVLVSVSPIDVYVGSANPTALTATSAFGTDNRVLRSDGTGRGAQASGSTLDDSDNATFPGSVNTPILKATTAAGVQIQGSTGTLCATFGVSGSPCAVFADGGSFAGQVNVTHNAGIITQQAATQDAVKLLGRAGGTGSYVATITPPTLSASITITLPSVTTDFGTAVFATSTFGTDNRLLRSDSTGRLAQSSGVTLDDSDGISGVVNITASGVVRTTNTTDATSATDTSASLNTAGGLAVAKKAFIGGSAAPSTPSAGNTAIGAGRIITKDNVAGGSTCMLVGNLNATLATLDEAGSLVGWNLSGGEGETIIANRKGGGSLSSVRLVSWDGVAVTELGKFATSGATLPGLLAVQSTTDATDKDTGSIVTEGGIAAEKSAWLGGQLGMAATSATTTEGKLQVESGQAKHYAFTNGIGGWVPKLIFSQYASVTQSGAVTSQSLFSATAIGTRTLPANFWKTGKTLRIRLSGVYTTDAAPGNATLDIKLGSTTFRSTGSFALEASETNSNWRVDLCITCYSTGASGSVHGQLSWDHIQSGGTGRPWHGEPGGSTSAVTIDTTAAMAFDAQWTATDAGTSITCTCAHIWEEG